MRAIIIEDEHLAAEDLIQTLKRVVPDIIIEKHLQSVQESITYFQTAKDIQLVFSDIQLGDGLSFQIFQEVQVDAPIVFCTAYDNYLLEAFKTNGIDYLLKPISDNAVKATLEKYFGLQRVLTKNTNTTEAVSTVYHELLNQINAKTSSIIVHQQDRIIPLPAEEIALCYIEHENVFIKTFKGKEYIVTKTLDELEKSLSNDFFRANRQHLLSRKALKHASYTLSRKLALDLLIEYSPRVYVSREKASTFLRWLEGQ